MEALAYAGASADFEQLLFEANDALTPNALDGGKKENNLYVSSGGRLSLVNVLPDGATEPNATLGAQALASQERNQPDFSHVISADGSRIFWTDLNTHDLYVSEDVGGTGERTVLISEGGRYWAANSEGTKVFFTKGGLFEYDLETGVATELSKGANVQSVVGSSEDGSYVYFVEEGGGLYVWHEGEKPRFIAMLSSEDGNESIARLSSQRFVVGDEQPGLGDRTAEATPNGHSLVFMSNNQSVEGYSPEVNSGTKLEEVYVYSYEDDRLFCVSCDRRSRAARS